VARGIAQEQTAGRRRRSEGKKAAVLEAAETLFVAQGYEATGVDAIAAQAQVSKRTVYDHFGDKQTIFLYVLERVTDALAAAVRAALDEELTPGRDLREALTAFADRIVTGTFASSDYAAFRRLTGSRSAVPRLPEHVRKRPERMLEERIAMLAASGALHAPVPRTAARHFTALTFSLALESLAEREGVSHPPALKAIIADGVDAFLRAYPAGHASKGPASLRGGGDAAEPRWSAASPPPHGHGDR
jgi:TetR/AcrR family transcriptional regulator, mexJK operon transcriptional repressor